MTSIRWTAVRLAIFTLVTIVVTTWLASIIGNFTLFTGTYEVKAEFSDATGVLNGDVVKAAGVTIGRVKGVTVEDGRAVVTMSIEGGIDLPADVTAHVRFRNLIGQRMISLEDEGSGTAGLLQAGDLISLDRTEPAFDLTELFNGLRPLIRSTDPADINRVTQALIEALEGRGDEFESFVGNVAALSETVASRDQEIASLLDNVNIVASDLAGRDAQLRNTLSSLNDFLGDVAASRGDLEQALLTLDQAATTFNRIIERNGENIEQELADLAVIFDAVNDRRAELRRALKALPGFVIATERVTTYGQWSLLHVVDLCKDDTGDCGRRGRR
jgi:phospholipid/cholesterol/gamma-HCH transport system substrate-binding protein